jgi:RIO-like serine/threonine protein kinase
VYLNILSDEVKSSVTVRVNNDISQIIQYFRIKRTYRHTHTHIHTHIHVWETGEVRTGF